MSGAISTYAAAFGGRSLRDALRQDNLQRIGTPLVDTLARFVGGEGQNVNGALAVQTLTDGVHETDVLLKPDPVQAAREALAGRLARRLRLDHLVPAAVLTPRGAAIEMRHGRSAEDAGIRTSAQLEDFLTAGYARRQPELTPIRARELAHFDAQMMRVFDYLTANSDRHLGNVLVHDDGTATWIDHGHLGVGHNQSHPFRPRLRMLSLPPDSTARWEQIDPAVLEHIRAHLRPEDFMRDAARVSPSPELKASAFQMQRRLQYLFTTGTTDFFPERS